MQITALSLPDIFYITPKRYGDHRGFFAETYRKDMLQEAGIEIDFVQDNMSLSSTKHTLRGLHFQKEPYAQDKLISVLQGSIIDVAVDIRKNSKTFGQHIVQELSAERGDQLLVPKGFAHGFLTLLENTLISYKVSDYYNMDADSGIAWDDPDLNIDWGLGKIQPILSQKDQTLQSLSDYKRKIL